MKISIPWQYRVVKTWTLALCVLKALSFEQRKTFIFTKETSFMQKYGLTEYNRPFLPRFPNGTNLPEHNSWLVPKLQEADIKDERFCNKWSHTALRTHYFLKETVLGMWTERFSENASFSWPLRNPDTTPPDNSSLDISKEESQKTW